MAVATQSSCRSLPRSRAAARELATLGSAYKDRALLAIADALEARTPEILEANARDLEAGRESGLSPALMDRLALDEARVAAMARGVREIVALPDPVGEVIDGSRFANGLEMRKVRVPLGVVAVVYEARPNVTIDAAALCLKSPTRSCCAARPRRPTPTRCSPPSRARPRRPTGCPRARWRWSRGGGREELAELAGQEGLVDLVIPRGGEEGRQALAAVAKVPVIYAASGNCHVYVDASADLDDRPDHPQREDPAAEVYQRRRDAARPRRGRRHVPARRAAGARRRRRAARRRARARGSGVPVAEATDEDYARSSSRWCSPSAWSTRPQTRSSMSTRSARAARRS